MRKWEEWFVPGGWALLDLCGENWHLNGMNFRFACWGCLLGCFFCALRPSGRKRE